MADGERRAAATDGWRLNPLTVGGALAAAAARHPDRDAIVVNRDRATYFGLVEAAVDRARGLLGLRIGPGSHVGLLMPNSFEFLVLFHAVTLVGARAVTLNSRYREEDLRTVLPGADLDLLVIGGQALPHTDFRAMLTAAFPPLADWRAGAPLRLADAPRLRAVLNFGDSRETAWPTQPALATAAEGVPKQAVRRAAEAVAPEDVCLMMFSSGTTARPKACMLTHANLTRTGAALAERFAMTERDRFWDPLPFFHMSVMLPLAACRAAGSAFVGSARFEVAEALDTLEREGATIAYPTFPIITTALLDHPSFGSRDLSALRIVLNVGPVELMRRYQAALPEAAHLSCYGLTEGSGVPVYGELSDTREEQVTTCGRPFPGVELRIRDPETGRLCEPGEPGEIQLNGFCVFAGYYGDEARTRDVVDADGWLSTGDRGALDAEGRVLYQGRFKDMLKIGGENVAAVEIEGFLATHPDVLMAQVIGVPDDHLWEVAAAFVELRPGRVLTAEDVVRHCLGRIASYKIPRYVRFVDDWPMSATKVQKFRLADTFEPNGKIDPRKLERAPR